MITALTLAPVVAAVLILALPERRARAVTVLAMAYQKVLVTVLAM